MVEETEVPDENHRLTLHGLMENGFHIKVAYAVHFSDTLFISVLLLFSSSSYAKYMLPERAPDQKYIKHQKRTFAVKDVGFYGKNRKEKHS